jgi:hypothetical protein
MLLLFAPFTALPADLTRLIWVAAMFLVAVWVVRRLGLPGYWVAFPPLFQAIFLGHPEVLVIALLVVGGPLSGVAAVIKPYAAAPLLAERRWSAFLVAIAVVLITSPFLPWATFIADLPAITANLVRQNHGDSTFGSPILMVVAIVTLVSLGVRRGLWLSVPLLWPLAQPMYKTVTLPALFAIPGDRLVDPDTWFHADRSRDRSDRAETWHATTTSALAYPWLRARVDPRTVRQPHP